MFIGIHKVGDSIAMGYSVGSGYKGQRWHQHFVAWLDSSNKQGQLQGRCAIHNGHYMLRTGDPDQHLLESLRIFAN